MSIKAPKKEKMPKAENNVLVLAAPFKTDP